MLEEKEQELADIRAAPKVGTLSWNDAVSALVGDASLRAMRRAFRDVTGMAESEREFAKFCLYREFFRRPKRMNSAETMGLISLRYPALAGTKPPRSWRLEPGDWDCFLKLVVDFFLRDISAVDLEEDYLRWMGIPVRQRYAQGPGYQRGLTARQRGWPMWDPARRSSRLPRLLQRATGLDESQTSVDLVNEALVHAWEQLRECLQPQADGYVVKLREDRGVQRVTFGGGLSIHGPCAGHDAGRTVALPS